MRSVSEKTLLKSPLFLLFLITLFGAVTRVWFFWEDGLHVDEKFTLDLVRHDLLYIIQYSLTDDCNPPLFYIIDWISVQIFGINAFAERLPSVICGILLIPAVYALGAEIRGKTLGLFSAVCVVTLGNIWFYSQFGRAYMLECLLFTILCIYFVRLVRIDSRTYHWIMIVIISVALAFTHLFAIIPLSILWLYLLWQYRLKSIKWVATTVILSSPLLLLFNAIIGWRLPGRAQFTSVLNWYGATFNQLIVFAPLEYFGYVFVILIPMIVYSTWIYRSVKEVLILAISFVLSYCVLLAVCDITPVFLRYLILYIPALITIGFLPVADFVDNKDFSNLQKWFVVGSFAIFYIAITVFAFATNLYQPKG